MLLSKILSHKITVNFWLSFFLRHLPFKIPYFRYGLSLAYVRIFGRKIYL